MILGKGVVGFKHLQGNVL